MKKLKFDRGRFIQGVILFGFSVYLIKLLETGEMHLLVSPTIQMLLLATLGLLILMTFFALGTVFTSETVALDEEDQEHHSHDHDHHHDHAHHVHDHDLRPKPRKGWILIALPVIVGLSIPAQALGSNLLSSGLQSKIQIQQNYQLIREKQQKNELANATAQSNQHAAPATGDVKQTAAQQNNPDFVDISKLPKLTVPASALPPKPKPGSEISLADLFNNIFTAPQYYFNQSFKITGFVYHPPGWPTNRLILIRYMITCCIADANPIGITVEMPNAAKYPNDTWLQIVGTLSARAIPDGDTLPPIGWYNGSEEKPVLLGRVVKAVSQPKDPYLYPPKSAGFAGGHP